MCRWCWPFRCGEGNNFFSFTEYLSFFFSETNLKRSHLNPPCPLHSNRSAVKWPTSCGSPCAVTRLPGGPHCGAPAPDVRPLAPPTSRRRRERRQTAANWTFLTARRTGRCGTGARSDMKWTTVRDAGREVRWHEVRWTVGRVGVRDEQCVWIRSAIGRWEWGGLVVARASRTGGAALFWSDVWSEFEPCVRRWIMDVIGVV